MTAAEAGDARPVRPVRPPAMTSAAAAARANLGLVTSAPGPQLVAAAVAGPQDHRRVVGRPGAARVEAQARLDAGDGAVGVDGPLLAGLAVAVRDARPGSLRVRGVEALAAVHLQLLSGRQRPLLVGAAVAVPQRQLAAVGLGLARDVQAAARVEVAQRAGGAAAGAARAGHDREVAVLVVD